MPNINLSEYSINAAIRSKKGVERRLDFHNKNLGMIRHGLMEATGQFSQEEIGEAMKQCETFIDFYEEMLLSW